MAGLLEPEQQRVVEELSAYVTRSWGYTDLIFIMIGGVTTK
jgi:hypothetical protein